MDQTMKDPVLASTPSTRVQIMAALGKLPQARHFKSEHIERFLALMENDPRGLWHAERLSGIGGSEIGVFVSHLRGETDAFGGTPNGVLLEKLLVFMPKKTTLAMRKGILLEEGIRKIFLEDYKATRDFDAMEKLSSPAARLRPWVRYSPDDVVTIGEGRWLIDYKHPNEASLHNEISLRYLCQLHLGTLAAEYAGVKLNGMLLVQYPESGDDSLQVTRVPFDTELASDIL